MTAWRLLAALALCGEVRSVPSCAREGVLYKDKFEFTSKGVVYSPMPTGGYMVDAAACQQSCKASPLCKHFSYDSATSPPGACWLLYGEFEEEQKPTATSGPKVCNSTAPNAVMGTAVAAASPVVAKDEMVLAKSGVAQKSGAATPVAPGEPMITAKEMFTNSAGEHLVTSAAAAAPISVELVSSHHQGWSSNLGVITLIVLMILAALCVVVNCYCCPKRTSYKTFRKVDLEAAAASASAPEVEAPPPVANLAAHDAPAAVLPAALFPEPDASSGHRLL